MTLTLSLSGGFVDYSATPDSYTVQALTSLLQATRSLGSKNVPLKGLSVEYRLTKTTSFPGILSDGIAAWRYLIQDCGYSPSNIVLAGDSAGGMLSLSITRYLINEKPFGEGFPKGLVLYSVSDVLAI